MTWKDKIDGVKWFAACMVCRARPHFKRFLRRIPGTWVQAAGFAVCLLILGLHWAARAILGKIFPPRRTYLMEGLSGLIYHNGEVTIRPADDDEY